jgi:lipoyl(octanoyl) transferase
MRMDCAEAIGKMRSFTAQRGPGTRDEIWLVEHDPVFTMGLAARPDHLLAPGDIPVLHTERGGQVTYHGPGQAVAYLMIDLKRRGLMVRELVRRIEQAVIQVAASLDVAATRREGAPGVYVSAADGSAGAKLASVGIKVSRGCSYHGVALNADMNLEPFSRINPCGYPGMQVTDLRRQLAGRAAPALDAIARLLGETLADLMEA